MAELLAVLVRHQLLVEVETTIGDIPGPSHTMWLGEELGVLAEGVAGEERCAYAPVAPALMPWVLGHLLSLRRRPAPTLGHPITVERHLLDATMADVDAGAGARAVASLMGKGTRSTRGHGGGGHGGQPAPDVAGHLSLARGVVAESLAHRGRRRQGRLLDLFGARRRHL